MTFKLLPNSKKQNRQFIQVFQIIQRDVLNSNETGIRCFLQWFVVDREYILEYTRVHNRALENQQNKRRFSASYENSSSTIPRKREYRFEYRHSILLVFYH